MSIFILSSNSQSLFRLYLSTSWFQAQPLKVIVFLCCCCLYCCHQREGQPGGDGVWRGGASAWPRLLLRPPSGRSGGRHRMGELCADTLWCWQVHGACVCLCVIPLWPQPEGTYRRDSCSSYFVSSADSKHALPPLVCGSTWLCLIHSEGDPPVRLLDKKKSHLSTLHLFGVHFNNTTMLLFWRAVFNSLVELEFIVLLSPHLGDPGEPPPAALVRSLCRDQHQPDVLSLFVQRWRWRRSSNLCSDAPTMGPNSSLSCAAGVFSAQCCASAQPGDL